MPGQAIACGVLALSCSLIDRQADALRDLMLGGLCRSRYRRRISVLCGWLSRPSGTWGTVMQRPRQRVR